MFSRHLVELLSQHADPEKAGHMEAYMKNQFSFFGIKSPERKQLFRQHWNLQPKPTYTQMQQIVKELWKQPQRELQYCAIATFYKFSKKLESSTINLIEWLITHKSWWDTVDSLHEITGLYFRNFPEKKLPTTAKWMDSGNFWLQRMCIIFQLKYKNETDHEMLENYIVRLAGEHEFFIRKAIGWALREYSYTNPEWVRDFISKNEPKLSGLSIREGLKALNRKK